MEPFYYKEIAQAVDPNETYEPGYLFKVLERAGKPWEPNMDPTYAQMRQSVMKEYEDLWGHKPDFDTVNTSLYQDPAQSGFTGERLQRARRLQQIYPQMFPTRLYFGGQTMAMRQGDHTLKVWPATSAHSFLPAGSSPYDNWGKKYDMIPERQWHIRPSEIQKWVELPLKDKVLSAWEKGAYQGSTGANGMARIPIHPETDPLTGKGPFALTGGFEIKKDDYKFQPDGSNIRLDDDDMMGLIDMLRGMPDQDIPVFVDYDIVRY